MNYGFKFIFNTHINRGSETDKTKRSIGSSWIYDCAIFLECWYYSNTNGMKRLSRWKHISKITLFFAAAAKLVLLYRKKKEKKERKKNWMNNTFLLIFECKSLFWYFVKHKWYFDVQISGNRIQHTIKDIKKIYTQHKTPIWLIGW